MKLGYAGFKDMRPGLSAKLLPSGMATISQDCDTSDGTIRPRNARSVDDTTSLGGEIKTIYRMQDGTWLHWNDEVSVVRMPIENNENDRVAFTGTDQPRATDTNKAKEGGGTDYPEVSYALCLPAPTSILEGEVNQSTPEGLQIQWSIAGEISDTVQDKIARVYTYTFISTWGGVTYESAPADPTDMVYANDDDEVTLTNFAGMPSGPYLITGVRIYRSEGGGPYLFVSEQSFPLSTWDDTVETADLGDALETELWSELPDDFEGIVAMANGMLAAFRGNVVRLSVPYQGHAWPEDYHIIVDDEIAGLVPMGNMLLIITDGTPVLAGGNHPERITDNKLKKGPPCVSARSIVDTGNGAMYASEKGLVYLTSAGATIIPPEIISESYWEALVPSTIHACWHNGRYFGFYNSTAGFIFDPEEGELSLISEYCTASHSSGGKLYMAASGNVYEWDGSGSALSAIWQSKEEETRPRTFTVGRVDAQGYPVTFRFYADGALKHTETVADDKPFRMPGGYLAKTHQVAVTTDQVVDSIFVADTVSEIR